MSKIKSIKAREILDSRGNPTIEVEVVTLSGAKGVAIVPSGASTGDKEALELRDRDISRYQGKGVLVAVEHVNRDIFPKLLNVSVLMQNRIDHLLVELDGTKNKAKLGANAILGVSLAVAKAAANYLKIPLYQYLGGIFASSMPLPMANIINGGVHASNNLDFQEYMIIPISAKTIKEGVRMIVEVFNELKLLLQKNNKITLVGDEGGFAPEFKNLEEPFDYLNEAIMNASYLPRIDFAYAIDVAASEFYDPEKQKYILKGEEKSALQMIEIYQYLSDKYPLVSIEDGLDQNDLQGWQMMSERLGDKMLLIGDDLFVTNKELLQEGINKGIANGVLIKLNQIGTLSETFETIRLAKKHNYRYIISHRSGESEDSFIADLAVAVGADYIKTGSICRSERTAKYNQLMRIEEALE